jgi:dTDP-4-dehydrorhamnose reductase
MAQATALVTGAAGQVGSELSASPPAGWRVAAYPGAELDVTSPSVIASVLLRERPAVVFNTAAFTDVEAAEREVERAEAVNCRGAANLAEAAQRVGARVIHLSSDFVFSGEQGRPYAPEDEPDPLGVYGRTKLAGEQEVRRATAGAALVVRTAWVYGARGRNFVLGMLKRMASGEPVGVVADQIGTPTWAVTLADALWRMAGIPELRGVHHWTDAGVASWYDFAVAIQEEALAVGLLREPVTIRPLRTGEYPAAAPRPAYSVLDKSSTWRALGGPAPHWRSNLRRMLQGLAGA